MEFTTIKGVELASVGMAWPSASGAVTLTIEHLQDAYRAFEDPLIVRPRLKLGHTDPRFNDGEGDHDPYYDAEPALGSVDNPKLTNDGATLTADFVDVPVWLAEVLPSAYPSRSIEGAYEISEGPGGKMEARWGVETPGGKRYSFIMTACSLLGLSRPAVQDLEDLRFMLTEGGGVIVTGDPKAGGVPIAVSMSGMSGVSLEADVNAVIDAFCAEYCVDERYWWWPRAMRIDPNVIIADDDEGSLWSVGVKTDADQNVTFDEPQRVLQTFQPAPEAKAVLAAAVQSPREGRILKAFAAREQTALADRKRDKKGGVATSSNTSGMEFSEEQLAKLRARLSLAEDASEEDITAALEAEPEETTESSETEETTETETVEETSENETSTEETQDETTVPVDKTVLAELKANSELGRQAREQQVSQHRESVLKAALKDGKITPASKTAWETKLKAAPEATEAELAALPANLVPVEEIGHGGSNNGEQSAVDPALFSEMFPGHAPRKAAA